MPNECEDALAAGLAVRRKRGLGPVSLTPPVMDGMIAWYDALDGSTLTVVGVNVLQWDDKSGNGYHVTQSQGARQPTIGTMHTLRWDFPALHFTGG